MSGRVIVLGAGPAGLWTALELLTAHPGLEVTVIERGSSVGGIAGSFSSHGLVFDYGSHRLHPASEGPVLDSVKSLLGDGLLDRPRNGRIRLGGRFLRFPLKPMDLMLHLPPSFTAGVLRDAITGPFRRSPPQGASFADVLSAGLGRTICDRFYFPYAEKLWGLPPDMLSGVQARRRVAAGNLGRMAGKVLSSLRGRKGRSARFYYPSKGFGAICDAAAKRIVKLGGRILLGAEVTGVRPAIGDQCSSVSFTRGGATEIHHADMVFSTIPLTELTCMLEPAAPGGISDASADLSFRSMVLCYLVLDSDRYSEYDAHYFPESAIRFSRMSEPRNYSLAPGPEGRTGLCFELPCGKDDRLLTMSDDETADMVQDDMKTAGLPRPKVLSCFTRRITNAYPVYIRDFQGKLESIEAHLLERKGLITLGRQGLFAHDNTHHAMEMGMAAAACFNPGAGWDGEAWQEARRGFLEHVVVD